jgi:hypothetical protein
VKKYGGGVGGFPKDERFKYDKESKILDEISPGPTTANPDITFPNIGKSKRNRSFNMSVLHDTSRDRFKDNKKIFFKELERDV